MVNPDRLPNIGPPNKYWKIEMALRPTILRSCVCFCLTLLPMIVIAQNVKPNPLRKDFTFAAMPQQSAEVQRQPSQSQPYHDSAKFSHAPIVDEVELPLELKEALKPSLSKTHLEIESREQTPALSSSTQQVIRQDPNVAPASYSVDTLPLHGKQERFQPPRLDPTLDKQFNELVHPGLERS